MVAGYSCQTRKHIEQVEGLYPQGHVFATTELVFVYLHMCGAVLSGTFPHDLHSLLIIHCVC